MFKKKHKKAMAEIMDYSDYEYQKKTIVMDFLQYLSVLYKYNDSYIIKLSLSPNPKAILVTVPDYSAIYPLEKTTNQNVDYTDFISRYL